MIKKNFFITQIATSFGVILLGLIATAAIFLSKATEKWTRTDFVEKADLIASAVASSAQHYLCQNNINEMKNVYAELARKKEITYIALNRDDERILEIINPTIKGDIDQELSYTTYATIPACGEDQKEAELEIALNYQSLFQPIRTIQGILAAVLSIVFLIIISLIFFAGSKIQKRVSTINKKCDDLASGDFKVTSLANNQDEFTEILSQLNKVGVTLEAKIKEAEEGQARLASQAKLSSLGEMAGGVAHEINNPMAIISGRLNQIKTALSLEPPKIPEALTFVQKSQDTVKRVTDIVAGLKLFSRNADQDPFVRVTPKKIIDDSLTLTTERFKVLGIKLTVETDSSIEIFARPTQISQVLINLLNNSADAIEKIENKWITVKLFKESNQAVLEITDCGPGIPEAVLEKLMQPFFTTKPVGKGTGLGLSISRGIIQAHKGTFEYKKGCQNTTFVITIPLADSQSMAA